MKFGWCAPVEQARLIEETGFDFIELQLVSFEFGQPSGLSRAKRLITECPCTIEAFRSVLPEDMKLVGPSVDRAQLTRYFDAAAELMAFANAKIVVLGDGRSRSVPEGFERGRAAEQFLTCVDWFAESLDGTGAVLALEPLNRQRSNLINTVAEAARCVEQVGRPGLGIAADIYHMMEEGEPFSVLTEFAQRLVHVHLADSGRLHPGTGRYDYRSFFGHLKRSGYQGRLSVECATEPHEEAMRHSHAVVTQAWALSS